MKRIVEEKASTLTLDQFAQEIVLGKIASDIYNEAKKIAPLRHVGIRKSKLLTPLTQVQELQPQTQVKMEKAAEA
ncbi:30S ribosomal protein S3ae, partial [Candidatus Bathyarchaeota archaeon]